MSHNATLTRCLSFSNKSDGFDQNSNLGNITLLNCTAFSNGRNYGMNDRALASGKVLTIKNCISLTGSQSILAAAVVATNTWSSGFSVSASDFQSIDPTAAYGPRQADGSLPNITFMQLKQTSTLRNRGTNVGLIFNGTAPDLGCFETSESVPVSLKHFTATLKNKAVLLNWATASEQNNVGFTVEKCLNPSENAWKMLVFVKGNGTTSTPQYYTASDDNPTWSVNYYRLKQEDTDGKFTYSKTVSINLNAVEKPHFFPNPSTGNATRLHYFGTNAGQLDIKIYDTVGRLVHAQQAAYQIGQNELLLNVSALSAGRYAVQMRGSGKIEVAILMIVR